MEFVSRYKAHQPDANGYVNYTADENDVWSLLFKQQMELLPGRACDEYLQGLENLGLTEKNIPQLPEVNQKLKAITGWEVHPVAALIPARSFFELLANQQFPAATFIREKHELNYVKEPDIFHELFGHCPMLTHQIYADFMQQYAQKVLSFPESEWPLLQRLFWFTVEFGLIKTLKGLRIYGGGILSSINETVYCVESDLPLRIMFNAIAAFRMPYRIDKLQTTYFVIEDFKQLYEFVTFDFKKMLQEVHALGEYPPLFQVEENNPCIHIHVC